MRAQQGGHRKRACDVFISLLMEGKIRHTFSIASPSTGHEEDFCVRDGDEEEDVLQLSIG